MHNPRFYNNFVCLSSYYFLIKINGITTPSMRWFGDALIAGTELDAITKRDRKYNAKIAAHPQTHLHAIIGVPCTESP